MPSFSLGGVGVSGLFVLYRHRLGEFKQSSAMRAKTAIALAFRIAYETAAAKLFGTIRAGKADSSHYFRSAVQAFVFAGGQGFHVSLLPSNQNRL